MKLRFLRLVTFTLMTCTAVLTGCSLLSGASKPTVVISSPPSGSQYHEGDDVAVQSTSGDAAGVVRVELNVDGSVVRNDTPPGPQTNFSIIQTWKATQGSHTVTVRAYNAAGVSSDPAAISIQVNPAVALNNPSPTPTPASSAPTPTNTTAPASPGTPSPTTGAPPPPAACTNNAAFVADVTIPDGYVLAAGQSFNKTWQLRNTGTCVWGVGYQLVFVSGEAMTGSTAIAVPATAAGATVNIIVPMTAPIGAGNHAGTWRMRGSNGAVFGQSVTVKITVPGAPPPPPAGCSGTPVIASFTAASPTIFVGASTTLNWGAVTGADSVEIDHGIGGVPAPGSTGVSPTSTTTYTLTAHCGSTTATAQVTITVNPLPPPAIVVYDLIDKANLAGWSSGDPFVSLSFGGLDTDSNGFALWRNSFKLNDGSTPSRVLETHPKWVANGHILGEFVDIYNSGYAVHASDHISGKVGFIFGGTAGSVTFVLTIRPLGGPNTVIETIPLAYADGVKAFDYSLAAFAPKRADFTLRVDAGSSAGQDWAVWQDLRITR